MKITGATPRHIGGVSQQPAELRDPRRVAEQVNMMTDAVRGLVRRPGSLNRDYITTTVETYGFSAGGWRSFDFRVGAKDYALLVNSDPVVGDTNPPDIFCVNKTDREFIPVTVNGADVADLRTYGVGAATALGRYLLMAPKTIAPRYTTTNTWVPEANQKQHVLWVRGGAYSRRFAVALIRGNQKFWVTYTTPSASYPVVLDTSDILPNDPDYSKKVADRTNAYNSAALAWAGEALRLSTPEVIADGIASELRNAGFLASGATVTVVGSTVCITDASIEDVEANDAGDGSLLRAVGNTCPAPELLSTIAYPGKVVRIRPTNDASGQIFYMEAKAKDESTGAFTEVSWEECPGVRYELTGGLVFASVEAGTCYVSADLDWLDTQLADTAPRYVASVTGDADTTPVPEFFDKPITALAVFQDRLIVAADSFITASRPGDYLNFFRASLLSVAASDPVSFQVIGGEDDTIRSASVWDRNLFLAGDKRPYVLDGRRPLAPGAVSGTPISDIPDMAAVPPVPMGNFLFYTREGEASASVHQLRPGRSLDTPLTEELTTELDDYIAGSPITLSASGTPGMLFVRTTDAPGTDIYVYSYVDRADAQRTLEGWFRWEFTCGKVIACWAYQDELQMVSVRETAVATSAILDTVALDGKVPDHPYLDSCIVSGAASPYAHPEACTPYTVDMTAGTGQLAFFPESTSADFTASNTAPTTGVSVTFTPATTGALSYAWTFGDGGTSTAESPVHSYAAEGTYTVSLTVTTLAGPATMTKTAYIYVTPVLLEDFELGNLSQYSLLDGDNMIDFTLSTSTVYEGTYSLNAGVGGFPPSTIKRDFTGIQSQSLQVIFRLGGAGASPEDDATAIVFSTQAGGTSAPLVALIPRREAALDASRRPLLTIMGTSLIGSTLSQYCGSSALALDTWHRLTVTFNGASSTWTITNLSTMTTHSSGTWTALSQPTFDRLAFDQDISVGFYSYPVFYDAINLTPV